MKFIFWVFVYFVAHYNERIIKMLFALETLRKQLSCATETIKQLTYQVDDWIDSLPKQKIYRGPSAQAVRDIQAFLARGVSLLMKTKVPFVMFWTTKKTQLQIWIWKDAFQEAHPEKMHSWEELRQVACSVSEKKQEELAKLFGWPVEAEGILLFWNKIVDWVRWVGPSSLSLPRCKINPKEKQNNAFLKRYEFPFAWKDIGSQEEASRVLGNQFTYCDVENAALSWNWKWVRQQSTKQKKSRKQPRLDGKRKRRKE